MSDETEFFCCIEFSSCIVKWRFNDTIGEDARSHRDTIGEKESKPRMAHQTEAKMKFDSELQSRVWDCVVNGPKIRERVEFPFQKYFQNMHKIESVTMPSGISAEKWEAIRRC